MPMTPFNSFMDPTLPARLAMSAFENSASSILHFDFSSMVSRESTMSKKTTRLPSCSQIFLRAGVSYLLVIV